MPSPFNISELVSMIIHSERFTYKELYSIIRVSRIFRDVGVPLLWAHPEVRTGSARWRMMGTGFERLLPDAELAAFKDIAKKVITQHPVPDKWNLERFYLLARCIKSLTLSNDDHFLIEIIKQDALPAFSRLQDLEFCLEIKGLLILQYALGPQIKWLKLSCLYAIIEDAKYFLPVLKILQEAPLPSLQTLILDLAGYEPDATPEVCTGLSNFITTHPSLLNFEIRSGPNHDFQELFIAASALPDLKRFATPSTHLSLIRIALPVPDLNPHVGFPSLVHLAMSVRMEIVDATLSSIASNALEELQLDTWEARGHQLGSGLQALPRFTELKLFYFSWCSGTRWWNPENVVDVVTWESLQPVLQLEELESFTLKGTVRGPLFNDERLDLLTQSWPNLETLHIDTSWGHLGSYLDHPPTITLLGLACLVTNCPDLASLQISIDARALPATAPITAHPSVEDLHLSRSFIRDEDIDTVVPLLAQMWPNITMVAWEWEPLRDVTDDQAVAIMFGERWKRVWQQVEEALGRVLDNTGALRY